MLACCLGFACSQKLDQGRNTCFCTFLSKTVPRRTTAQMQSPHATQLHCTACWSKDMALDVDTGFCFCFCCGRRLRKTLDGKKKRPLMAESREMVSEGDGSDERGRGWRRAGEGEKFRVTDGTSVTFQMRAAHQLSPNHCGSYISYRVNDRFKGKIEKSARFPCWGEEKKQRAQRAGGAAAGGAERRAAAQSGAERRAAAQSGAERRTPRGQQPRHKNRTFKSGLLPKFHFHV